MQYTREDWVRAGLNTLAEAGVEAVRVEAIARKLSISKGSFYRLTAHDSRPLFRPGKIGTLIVAGLLLFADYLLLTQSGYLAPLIAPALIQWGCIFGTAVFFLRAVGDFRYVGFFKKVRHTVFGRQDTRLFTPLCLWLGMAFLLTVL